MRQTHISPETSDGRVANMPVGQIKLMHQPKSKFCTSFLLGATSAEYIPRRLWPAQDVICDRARSSRGWLQRREFKFPSWSLERCGTTSAATSVFIKPMLSDKPRRSGPLPRVGSRRQHTICHPTFCHPVTRRLIFLPGSCALAVEDAAEYCSYPTPGRFSSLLRHAG
jgi:hypothetical protein